MLFLLFYYKGVDYGNNQQHYRNKELQSKILQLLNDITCFQDLNDLNPEITEMWVNYREQDIGHPPHMHANNDISGILYVNRCSPTSFLDPRIQSLVVDLGNNDPVVEIKGRPNKLILFSSWLKHWVNSSAGKKHVKQFLSILNSEEN